MQEKDKHARENEHKRRELETQISMAADDVERDRLRSELREMEAKKREAK